MDVPADRRATLPRTVWAVGFVSMFMDISSEMIHALLPVFLATTLAVPVAIIGLIEGVSEATASLIKLFSGRMSDWLGKRKALLIIGYGMAALSKPLFPLAASAWTVLFARFFDRVGKGIRGAPRDALIADVVPSGLRGAAYGLRQSLDTIGAIVGPLIAMGLLAFSLTDIRGVFWLAVIPGLLSVVVILLFVRETPNLVAQRQAGHEPFLPGAKAMPRPFWIFLVLAFVIQAARPSEGFILLRASSVGLDLALVPLGLVSMNVAFALSAYPAGALSDRVSRRGLVGLGTALLVASLLALAFASRLPTAGAVATVMAAAALWGLHLGFTQGLLAAMAADHAPPHLRGTAFGLFHLVSGIALLPGNVIFGWIWEALSPELAFLMAAGVTTIALLPLAIMNTGSRA